MSAIGLLLKVPAMGGGALPTLIEDDFTSDSGDWLDGDLSPAAITISGGRGKWSDQELSAEQLTNNDFSSWTGDDPDGWTVTGESGGDPEATERDSGQAHADTKTTGGALNWYDSSTGVVKPVYQSPTQPHFAQFSITASLVTTGASRFGTYGGQDAPVITTGTRTWRTYVHTTGVGIIVPVAPIDVTVDSCSFRALTTGTLVRVQQMGPVFGVQAKVWDNADYDGGLIILKDADNWIVAYLSSAGTTNRCLLDKCVAGTRSQVSRVFNGGFNAGDLLQLVPNADFNAFSVIAGGNTVIDGQSITDFSFLAGEWYAGMFATHELIEFDDFRAEAI